MSMRIMMAALGLVSGVAGCSTMAPRDRAELVATPSPCVPKRFDIYFAEGEARLTEAARTAIGLTATQLQGCALRSVRVLGLSDATGTADTNQALSERRALAVAEALAAAGWPAPVFELAAAGDAGAVTTAGVEEPLRRRTEVLVEATPQ